MRTSISLFILMALCIQLRAQNTIITLRGDTLNGTFSLVKRGGNEFVDFVDDQGQKKKFRLFDIKRIRTAENEIIEPIKVESGYTFGKLLSQGYLSLYSYRSENSNVTFNERIMIKLDGSSLDVPGAFGFKKAVSKFLSECPVVSQKVSSKELDRDDLDQVIQEFNACIDGASNKTNIVATPAVPVQSATLTSKLQTQIDDFKTLLKYSDNVENKEDVSDMFNDLTKKIIGNEKVPNYLKNILINSVSNDSKLKALIESMLK